MQEKEKEKALTPLQAIKEFCLECVGSQREVRLCTAPKCVLRPYRTGKNTLVSRERKVMSEQERVDLVARLSKGKQKAATRRATDTKVSTKIKNKNIKELENEKSH